MRIAVLGVGLIGGSIGLAAKRRLGAEVRGFDPDPAAREHGLQRQTVESSLPATSATTRSWSEYSAKRSVAIA